MPYRMPKGFDESKLPPVRWRRGDVLDVDPEHRETVEKLGGEEVTREEAAEVITDEAPGGRRSKPTAAKPRGGRATKRSSKAGPKPAAEVITDEAPAVPESTESGGEG
jgi:hypothetical protein